MIPNPQIFRGYDIRGITGKDLDAESMELIGKAHGTYLKSLGVNKAVVGSDNRLTSDEYRAAIIKGLLSTGVDVIDLGLALTSIVYWAQYHFQAKGGVMVTASHNPPEYNGCKLGQDFSDTAVPMEEIKKNVVEDQKFEKGKGKLEKAESNYIDDYFQDLIDKVGRIKKFKVVVDASNGAAGKFMPEILRQVGLEVVEQNCELDGSFPNGTPDPTEEKVAKRLAERVVKEKADLGFSYDADGDRMGIVDEKGGIIWNDMLVAIFADDALSQNPGATIVFNTLCSKVVEEIILKNGGKPAMERTGHAFIKARVQKEKAPFGGELSGHFYFMDKFYPHDDGAYASLRILDYLTRKNKTLSEVVESFPKYFSSPEIKLECPDDKKVKVIDRITENFHKTFAEDKVTEIDKVRVDFPDGMLIIRYSQNGPYITVKFEAKDKETYEKRRALIIEELKKYPEIVWGKGVNIEELER